MKLRMPPKIHFQNRINIFIFFLRYFSTTKYKISMRLVIPKFYRKKSHQNGSNLFIHSLPIHPRQNCHILFVDNFSFLRFSSSFVNHTLSFPLSLSLQLTHHLLLILCFLHQLTIKISLPFTFSLFLCNFLITLHSTITHTL